MSFYLHLSCFSLFNLMNVNLSQALSTVVLFQSSPYCQSDDDSLSLVVIKPNQISLISMSLMTNPVDWFSLVCWFQ